MWVNLKYFDLKDYVVYVKKNWNFNLKIRFYFFDIINIFLVLVYVNILIFV